MNVLVTGGAGFIGGTLAAELLDAGHSVTVLDNLSTGTESRVPAGADFVEADVKDRDSLADILAADEYDRVYHLAGNVGVRTQNTDRDRDVQENIIGTHNLLEAMHVNGVDDLVFASSSTVYGDADTTPTPEDYAPKQPVSLYSASKLSCEKLISVYT
ncbi:MAG: SDR family NAD(P)-dependent oxidoreductase, partial [Candidatus Nanohaloarchaea archaeon]